MTWELLFNLLHRFAQYQERDVSVGEGTDIPSFTYALNLAERPISAFQRACGAGLAEGDGNGALQPRLDMTGND